MSRSAAGVDYRPFQVFQKLVLSRSRELYYIGGSDVLPAPLEPKREAYVISRLKTDQEQEARSLLIEHNLRLVVYIARKFDNTPTILISYFFLLCPNTIHPTNASMAIPTAIHGTRY